MTSAQSQQVKVTDEERLKKALVSGTEVISGDLKSYNLSRGLDVDTAKCEKYIYEARACIRYTKHIPERFRKSLQLEIDKNFKFVPKDPGYIVTQLGVYIFPCAFDKDGDYIGDTMFTCKMQWGSYEAGSIYTGESESSTITASSAVLWDESANKKEFKSSREETFFAESSRHSSKGYILRKIELIHDTIDVIGGNINDIYYDKFCGNIYEIEFYSYTNSGMTAHTKPYIFRAVSFRDSVGNIIDSDYNAGVVQQYFELKEFLEKRPKHTSLAWHLTDDRARREFYNIMKSDGMPVKKVNIRDPQNGNLAEIATKEIIFDGDHYIIKPIKTRDDRNNTITYINRFKYR